MSQPMCLVDAGRSLQSIHQPTSKVPNKIHMQLALLIKHELGFRVEGARALGFIRIIYVEFAGRQIVGGR